MSAERAIKEPCHVATTGNVTLYGLQTIDGVALAASQRILVRAQTNPIDNGIYEAASGGWQRASDFDAAGEVVGGTLVMVMSGSELAGSSWRVSGSGGVTIGTHAVLFEPAFDSDSVSFLQSGIGALSRTVQKRLNEIVSIEDYGASPSNTATQNQDAINGLIAAVDGGAHPIGIYFPPKAYSCGHIQITGGNVVLLMQGCTLFGPAVRITTSPSAPNVTLLGGRLIDTSGTDTNFLLDILGPDNVIDGIWLEKNPEAGGYMAYFRSTASRARMSNYTTRGSNGIFVEGVGMQFTNYDMQARSVGGDDCFGVKAVQGVTKDLRFGPGRVKNYAYVCSIGSEIGTLGASDPSYSKVVRNVIVSDIVAENCTGVLFIKPGTVEPYEYRDGTVEDILCENITLTDMSGAKFQRGVAITAARGARVRRITARNININARAYANYVPTVGAAEFYLIDYTAHDGGGSAASLSDIDVQVKYNDPFDGAANAANTPGYPVQYIARAECQTVGFGAMSRLALEIDGNGCQEVGILVGDSLDDAVTVRRAAMRNVSVNPSSTLGRGGVLSLSNIQLRDLNISTVNGYPVGGTDAAFNSTAYTAETAVVPIGSHGPGAVVDIPIWVMPRLGYIHSVQIVNGGAITQNTTNYSTFEFLAASGAAFASVNTSTTNFAANTAVNAHSGSCIRNVAALNVPKNQVIRFAKKNTGTGQPTTGMIAVIHYVTHGS